MQRHGLSIAPALVAFLEDRALPGSGVDADRFWSGMADILARFAPENAALLARRDALQAQIDDWYAQGGATDGASQRAFLTEIGYLAPEPAPFTIAPRDVDAEVAELAGPQLVVPMLNARFLLNAANARWGSLYDALYGTDALAPVPTETGYDRCAARRSSAGPAPFWTMRCRSRADGRPSRTWPRLSKPCATPTSFGGAANAAGCSATMACISRSWSIRPNRSVAPTRRASPTLSWSPR